MDDEQKARFLAYSPDEKRAAISFEVESPPETLEPLKFMLGHIGNINVGFSEPAIVKACARRDNVDVVSCLLEAGAYASAPNQHGDTAMHYATLYGQPDVCQALIDHRADINARNDEGDTVLTYTLRRLDDESAESYTACVRLLVAAGHDFNMEGAGQFNALARALAAEHLPIIEAMVLGGADVEAPSTFRRQSALCTLAAETANPDIAKFLLNQGANVNAANRNGDVPLTLVAGIKSSKRANVPGFIDVLLVDSHTRVNAANAEGQTALYRFARRGDVKMVQKLLAAGADPNAVTTEGTTVAGIAQERGYAAVLEILTEAGGHV